MKGTNALDTNMSAAVYLTEAVIVFVLLVKHMITQVCPVLGQPTLVTIYLPVADAVLALISSQ